MAKIRFLVDYQVNAVGGESYKKGQVVTGLSDASVQHFLNRGVAEEATEPPKKEPTKPQLSTEEKAEEPAKK